MQALWKFPGQRGREGFRILLGQRAARAFICRNYVMNHALLASNTPGRISTGGLCAAQQPPCTERLGPVYFWTPPSRLERPAGMPPPLPASSYRAAASRQLSGSCVAAAWQLPNGCLAASQQLPPGGSFLGASGELLGSFLQLPSSCRQLAAGWWLPRSFLASSQQPLLCSGRIAVRGGLLRSIDGSRHLCNQPAGARGGGTAV